MLIKEKKIKTERGKCKITLESDGFICKRIMGGKIIWQRRK